MGPGLRLSGEVDQPIVDGEPDQLITHSSPIRWCSRVVGRGWARTRWKTPFSAEYQVSAPLPLRPLYGHTPYRDAGVTGDPRRAGRPVSRELAGGSAGSGAVGKP